MSIEITDFADVSISVSPSGPSSGNFGILGFLTKSSDTATNPISPAERARAYSGFTSVQADWPADSEVVKAATAFFAQTPTPKDFTVLMAYDTAQKAQLIGGTHDTVEDIIAAYTGAGIIDITIDGTDINLTDIDLSGSSTHADIAAALTVDLDAVLTGVVVSYGAYGYIVTGVTNGSAGTITFASGDVSDSLGLSQHQGKISNGVDIETPVAALSAAVVAGIDFVGLVTHKDYRDQIGQGTGENTTDIADWAEANKKIFCNTTNSLAALNSALSSDVGSLLKAKALRFTLTSFSKNANQYPSASVFGRAASVNFATINSTITLNLKNMPGITAEDLTPAEFKVLRSKYISAVVQIGKSVQAFTDSRMASGSWLDTTHGLLWLENRAEVDMFTAMQDEIPFTQAGLNTAIATLESSLDAAVRNGLAAPGFLPDGTFLPEGYIVYSVPLADVAASDKSNRVYNGLSFDMVGAGSLQEVAVSGNFAE